LERWSIKGARTENPGVWEEIGERKIAALGVHLRRSVTSYGVGLNVQTDLRWFDRIVACGLVGKGVTSMMALEEERGFSGIEKFNKEKPDVWELHAQNNKSAMGPDLDGEYIEANVPLQIGFHKERDMLELQDHHRDMAVRAI